MRIGMVSIGEPKRDLQSEAVELANAASNQDRIKKQVEQTLLPNTEIISELLSQILGVAKQNEEISNRAAGEQYGLAEDVKKTAGRLAITANGTGKQEVVNAARLTQSLVEPAEMHAKVLKGAGDFNAQVIKAVGSLVKMLETGGVQTLQATTEDMQRTQTGLARAADAAQAHVPIM